MTEIQFNEGNREKRKAFSSIAGPVATPHGVHRHSHLDLIDQVPQYPVTSVEAELSAVVVPTRRPPAQARVGLELAAQCAESRNARLVVIRSGPAGRDPFPAALAATTAGPTIVIDLPDRLSGLLADFENDHHRAVTRGHGSDLGLKRNLALLIGLCCGWQTVLLLDDDITLRPASRTPRPLLVPSVEDVLRLHDVLADFARYPDLIATGYLQKDFDDQSVICRVRKLAGLEQAGFISGGAMIVRCGSETPFFPDLYNEDWLFLFAVMLRDQHRHPSSGVKRIGPVHQVAYYPYRPDRARREEFGDTLAEGLYLLLDHPATEILRVAAASEYWQDVVHERTLMVAELLVGHLRQHGATDDPVLNDVEGSLRAALGVHPARLPEAGDRLAGYVQAFAEDLRSWYARTERLAGTTGGRLDLPEALARLGLSGQVTTVSPPGSVAAPRVRCAS